MFPDSLSLRRSTRQQDHQRTAQVLGEQFPDLIETQPELVSQHDTEAGLAEQAIGYWQRAGERSNARSAHMEAAAHCTTGLALLAPLPETLARAWQEINLRMVLGPAWIATKGPAALEVEQTYARALVLCQEAGETPQLFPTLWGLSWFYRIRGVLSTARELEEQLYQLAQCAANPTPLMEAHSALGTTLLFLGEYPAARTHLEQGIALADPAVPRT
jgi:predicted ATPase